jgi:hypothetical protein
MTVFDDAAFGYDDGDIDTNRTAVSPHLNELVEARLSRRQTLRGGVSAMATAVFGSALLAGCGDDEADAPDLQVSAGQSVATSSGRVVTLAGTVSGGTPNDSAWTQVSGPTVALTPGSAPNSVVFTAPSVPAATPLTFRFSAINNNGPANADATVTVNPAQLGFEAVAKSLADTVAVPAGYSVTVLYRLGDPINASTPAYANNGSDTNFGARAGDHHDGMSYFGLAASGNAPDPNNSTRGLLALNHENISQRYLHPNGPTTVAGARPEAEALKEIEAHGVSIIEVSRAGASGAWSYNQSSALNRRITPLTPMQINGPARGAALMRTLFSPAGTDGRGTINNCANGYTPWNTYLTAEENWAGYFRRDSSDTAARSAKVNALLTRYGGAARAGNYGWATVQASDPADTRFRKFNITSQPGAPADGTGDFRNEVFQYGWIVEIDPFNPQSTPRKRTALGRMNHEGAWPGRFIAGTRPAWYMGCDAQNEYIYKFVSATPWAAADATATDRLAIGDKYLDTGTLYVARFDADGTGAWLPLVFGQGPLTSANAAYAFADQADVLIATRIAADALGATRMDRPEWTAVNPATGEMYCTLTNNSSRTVAGGANPTNAANPRAYTDLKRPSGDQGSVDPVSPPQRTSGNANGHIVRLRENGDTTEALAFTWDVYLYGAGADLDPANVNLSGLNATNDFSSPDGLWFSRPTNAGGLVNPLVWVQTDDGAYTDVTNCMMLLGQPGRTGDGTTRTITNTITPTTGSPTTGQAVARVGAAPGDKLRRFLVGPVECEITGIDTTPDGRTAFVNIQHPGEDATNPNAPTSNWPANQGGSGVPSPTGPRPRSATIVITKNDGGVIGL